MPNQTNKAFTLIELLVVISIIALLIGILLPALGAARQSAQSIKCATQMRQFTQANHMYANDNDDSIVPARSGGSNIDVTDYWAHDLYPYIGQGELDQSGAAIELDTADADNVFVCPSSINGYKFSDDNEQEPNMASPWYRYTYSFNLLAPHWSLKRAGIDGTWDYIVSGGAKLTSIMRPTETAFLLEGSGYYINTDMYWLGGAYPTLATGLAPHNSDSANVPYYDGHTANVKPRTEVPMNSDAIFWGGSNQTNTYKD
ncbi:prepilin-type N-terminal cleavage/methylation domain-containing protein [Planctomycetota bacterium]|nr:prepilin-type N-terminal cleavage/methylation domain-containing protein [Planctomycetota bacterium]